MLDIVTLELAGIYIIVGAFIHTFLGIYRAYSNYLQIKFNKARIGVEFLGAILFGFFGALALSSLMPAGIGIELAGLFSAIIGGNVINIITKRLGVGKFEIIVSDQQLDPTLTPREANALTVVKTSGKITRKLHEQINSVTEKTALRDLEGLVKKNILSKHGHGKSTYYKMTFQTHSRHSKIRKNDVQKMSRKNYSQRIQSPTNTIYNFPKKEENRNN